LPGDGGHCKLQFRQARGGAGRQVSARARVDPREEAKMVGHLRDSVERRTRRGAAMAVVAEHREGAAVHGHASEDVDTFYRQMASP
jgi:hypothetical protein